jgi:hypothetical protein
VESFQVGLTLSEAAGCHRSQGVPRDSDTEISLMLKPARRAARYQVSQPKWNFEGPGGGLTC